MIYRLAFIRMQDGYLKIIASAKGTPALTAIHLNPSVLKAAAQVAGLCEKDVSDLIRTAEEAWIEEGLDVCCEAIDLDSEQIVSLRFLEDWRRLA